MVTESPSVSRPTDNIITKRAVTSPIRYTMAWSVALLLTDILMFVLAAYVAGSLVDRAWGFRTAELRLLHSSVIFIAVWIVIFYALGLYSRSLAMSVKDEFYFTVIALVFGVTPQLIIFTVLPSLSTSRLVLLLSTAIAIAMVGTSRTLIHLIRAALERHRHVRILVAGAPPGVELVSQSLRGPNTTILNLRTHDEGTVSTDDRTGAERLIATAREWRCTNIVLVDPDETIIRQALTLSEASGLRVSLALPGFRLGVYKLEPDRVVRQDLLTPTQPKICQRPARFTKRMFDLSLASLALLICSPIMLLAALLVFGESGFPVLFRQDRVGRYGRVFKMLKFRSMNLGAGPNWATPGDARITRVGSFLRRTSIDELPQLFNVLKGEMSLVGPRPEMLDFEKTFARTIPLYPDRRLSLPGITGLAQVNMKRNLSPEDVEQVLDYDLFYVKHWSLFLDFTVLLKTCVEFLFHRAI